MWGGGLNLQYGEYHMDKFQEYSFTRDFNLNMNNNNNKRKRTEELQAMITQKVSF